jgi:2-keto-3-deoxy-L-rhamnonate aldolase RhmA
LFTIHPFNSFEDWDRKREGSSEETFIIPQPESRGALDSLEDVMRLPGVKIVLIAMTDGSRVLTDSNRPDFYHPALWEYVDRAVALGKEYGVTVGANTSYAYDLDEIEHRISVLQEHGVQMILVQGAMFLFQVTMTGFLKRVRKIIEP